MKGKKIIIGIFVFLFISLFLASSVSAARFSLSRESVNRVTDSMGEFLKGSVLLWYSTDSSGELRTEYETQRRVVDFILFFIMFFSLALLGLRKVYKEGGNAVNALAFAIGALLSLSLVAFTKVTLGLLFPFAKNILFFIILWVIYLILAKIIGDDKTSKKIISLIIAGGITWFAFSYVGGDEGWNPFGWFDMTTSTKEIANPQTIKDYLVQGKAMMEQQRYAEAKGWFVQVIRADPNPRTNKYFDDALFYLREGIFDHMAKNMRDVMEAKLYAGQVMAENGLKEEAIAMLKQVVVHAQEMDGEIKRQEERIKDMQELENKLKTIR